MTRLSIWLLLIGPLCQTSAAESIHLLFQRAEDFRIAGRYQEAEPLYRQILTIQESLLGDAHPNLIDALNGLADLYHAQGRNRDAEPLCRRSLQLGESVPDRTDIRVASTLNTLGDIHRDTDRYLSADTLYKRSLTMLEAKFGPNHPAVARVVNNMAALRVKTGHFDQAKVLFERALNITQLFGGTTEQMAGIMANIAVCEMERRRHKSAEEWLNKSLHLLSDETPAARPILLNALECYATLLRRTRRVPQATKVEQRITALRLSPVAKEKASREGRGGLQK